MQLGDVLAALERHGVRYAVFGGLAMAAHGLDRATRDLDLFVAPDEDNVQRLRAALHAVYDDASIDEVTAEDLAGEYPAIQYGPPGVDYTIDLVSRLGEALGFDDLEIQRVAAGEVEFAVVSGARQTRVAKRPPACRPVTDPDASRTKYPRIPLAGPSATT